MIEWDDLKQRIGFKKFPEDYLTGVKWEKYMELPKGSDIFMYRETEGIYLVIDMEKLYFLDLALARFVQMCALTGNTSAPILSHSDASRVVKNFKNDIEKWDSIMRDLLKEKPDKERLREQLWELSGYSRILHNFMDLE